MIIRGVVSPTPNKQLYNGGSEWQKDFGNLPDYYQTFYRNYDAALARWVAVDPMAESAESMTGYQYAGNNPVMYNDPMGNVKKAPQDDPMSYSLPRGGAGGNNMFANADAIEAYVNGTNAWGAAEQGQGDFADAVAFYNDGNSKNITASDLVNFGKGLVGLGDGQVWLPEIHIQGNNWSHLWSDIQNEAYATNYYSAYRGGNANQGGVYQNNMLTAVAMAVGEANNNLAQVRANASTIINRTNQNGTSLYDPNWLAHMSRPGKASGWVSTNGHNVDYNGIIGQGYAKTMASSNPYIQAAIAVFNSWGSVDYSNPNGFADTGTYYFYKLSRADIANGTISAPTYSSTGSVITLQVGNQIYYRDK